MPDQTLVDALLERVANLELRLERSELPIYPTCSDCGALAATEELLQRHRIRSCPGVIPKWGARAA